MAEVDLLLASRSPRRHRLLHQLGVRFDVIDIDVDETPATAEHPRELVPRLALAKARAGSALAPADLPVLGADTEVVVDGEVLGKPVDHAAAMRMLRRLSGREHEVISAVALIRGREAVRVSVTRVRLRGLDDTELECYCRTGEPFGKAGAYAIQGYAAAFIERIEGSYSGVMGLPLFETAALLQEFAVPMGRAPAP